MGKLQAAVIFGGQSSEHIVSCMSAVNVIEHIDRTRYDVLLVGITEDGHWIKADSLEDVKNGTWRDKTVSALLLPDATKKCILLMDGDSVREVRVDVVFPVLHGLYGEDGTIQGLLELAKIPYVGCGVLSSAVSMDKLYTKIIVDDLGVRQAAYEAVYREQLVHMESVVERVEKHFSYPVFIKPSNAGSSRGVTKADDRQALEAGLSEAARHDRKILVEETIIGREIECAVFGGGLKEVVASGVGEILAAAEFYDFEAKYYNEESRTVTDPELPAGAAERVRQAAMDIFRAVDGYGLARVDFFVRTMSHGYDTVLSNDAENISIGQRQLLTIARVFLCDPAVIILDEATSSVDTRTEIEIGKAMKALMKNRTSFVIAHRLSTIIDADLILFMQNGNIIEQGTHETLLKAKGAYADLYYSQFA